MYNVNTKHTTKAMIVVWCSIALCNSLLCRISFIVDCSFAYSVYNGVESSKKKKKIKSLWSNLKKKSFSTYTCNHIFSRPPTNLHYFKLASTCLPLVAIPILLRIFDVSAFCMFSFLFQNFTLPIFKADATSKCVGKAQRKVDEWICMTIAEWLISQFSHFFNVLRNCIYV